MRRARRPGSLPTRSTFPELSFIPAMLGCSERRAATSTSMATPVYCGHGIQQHGNPRSIRHAPVMFHQNLRTHGRLVIAGWGNQRVMVSGLCGKFRARNRFRRGLNARPSDQYVVRAGRFTHHGKNFFKFRTVQQHRFAGGAHSKIAGHARPIIRRNIFAHAPKCHPAVDSNGVVSAGMIPLRCGFFAITNSLCYRTHLSSTGTLPVRFSPQSRQPKFRISAIQKPTQVRRGGCYWKARRASIVAGRQLRRGHFLGMKRLQRRNLQLLLDKGANSARGGVGGGQRGNARNVVANGRAAN